MIHMHVLGKFDRRLSLDQSFDCIFICKAMIQYGSYVFNPSVDLVCFRYNKCFHWQHEKGRPLPKFGEWDVNNPASADGFTVIFAKARDEKAKGAGGAEQTAGHTESGARQDCPASPRKVASFFLSFFLYYALSFVNVSNQM